VEKEEYVREARGIPSRYSPRLGVRGLLPGGGKQYLTRFAHSLRTVVDDLGRLSPPPADVAQLRAHFLQPMIEQADFLQREAESAPRLLSFRRAMAILARAPQPSEADQEFCAEYGLDDRRAHASFPERAAQVGIDLSSVTFSRRPLTRRQLVRIRNGGPRTRTLVWLSFLSGCLGFLLGLRTGVSEAVIAGAVCFWVVGAAIWVALHRAGAAVVRRIREGVVPDRAVGVISRVGNYWRVSIVVERDPDNAVSSTIAWRAPGRARGAFLVGVVGDPSPGGRFALVLEDESILVSYRDARSTYWPPLSYEQPKR
jgi:hypothetical protein